MAEPLSGGPAATGAEASVPEAEVLRGRPGTVLPETCSARPLLPGSSPTKTAAAPPSLGRGGRRQLSSAAPEPGRACLRPQLRMTAVTTTITSSRILSCADAVEKPSAHPRNCSVTDWPVLTNPPSPAGQSGLSTPRGALEGEGVSASALLTFWARGFCRG